MTREEFIGKVENWHSHRPLLWEALEATTGHVVEFGIGDGSTIPLHNYCLAKGRMLFSYENNLEYFHQYEPLHCGHHYVRHVQDWEQALIKHREPIGVFFADHAPGERRKYDIAMFCNLAQIVVVHDSEPEATGYGMPFIEPLFKYKKVDPRFPAHTTAFSNFIDVSKWTL